MFTIDFLDSSRGVMDKQTWVLAISACKIISYFYTTEKQSYNNE